MKKFALSSLLIVLMVSCTINEDEPDTYWKVVTISVDADDWVRYTDNLGLNQFYACEVDMPEITSFVYNSGLIQTYYVESTPNRFQESLPYVRHYENAQLIKWTTTIDCAYSTGSMTFYITHSDFVNVPPDKAMTFRVVIMW